MGLKSAFAVLLLFTLACAGGDDGGVTTARDSGSGDDTGTVPSDAGFDGGAADTGPVPMSPSGDAIPAGPASALADAAEDPSSLGSGDPSSCWDGLDNDENLESDCEDAACDAVPACALDNGRRCADEDVGAFAASSCAAGPATIACLGVGESIFGSPAPWVIGDRLHPGGADFDSGVVLSTNLMPRTRRVVMTGTFGEPSCPGATSCVEVASFGLTTTTTFDATTRVDPTAVLQLSAARQEVALLLSGTVIMRWPFDPAAPAWTLDLRPTGEVVVMNGVEEQLRRSYGPPASAAAVVYGRNINRAEDTPGGAGLEGLTFSVELCDIPDAWVSRSELTIVDPGGTPVNLDTLRAPSVRRGGDDVLYMALEAVDGAGGRIVLAAEDGSDTRFALQHPADSQIFAPSDVGDDVIRVGDPELYWDGTDWHLYFTGDLGGERRIGHATGATFGDLAFTGWVVTPSLNVRGVDEPSVTRSGDGRWILAVGVSRDGGRTIDIYVGSTPDGFEPHGGILDASLFRAGGGGTDFDSDEVGGPSIRVVGNAYHLYYAGRRGTRWSIGVWTSAELVYWRPVTERSGVLRGAGDGFDALGVRAPELLVEGDTAKLFYVGESGDRASLGVAIRPQPEFSP